MAVWGEDLMDQPPNTIRVLVRVLTVAMAVPKVIRVIGPLPRTCMHTQIIDQRAGPRPRWFTLPE